MQYAINLAPFGPFADPRAVADLARDAEAAGWDALFLWDHIAFYPGGIADPWICLTAAALATERIRLGTMVTPLARRRPQVLAKQTATLDRLSNGRLILGVGLGIHPEEFDAFGEQADLRTRGEMLDESLDVLAGLWSGEKFSFRGKHYTVENAEFTPTPVQRPRIPIWVAGMWPNKRPFRRAARYEGVFPIDPQLGELAPEKFREIIAYTNAHRETDTPIEVSYGGLTSGPEDTVQVRAYADAGVTWWHEGVTPARTDRVRAGPPRIE